MDARCAPTRTSAASRLIGDVPIYVAPGSADHRAHPGLFRDDDVAGTPPDAYTDKGQLWGNPLYDWPALQRSGYRWWIARLARTFALYDLARIDHFRGFVAYWSVPRGARHALAGRWRRGPGRALFDHAGAALGALPIIAEDLGVITPPVERLRDALGLPGHGRAPVRLGARRARTTCTTSPTTASTGSPTPGTHDNDTLRGWYESLPDAIRARGRRDAAARGGRGLVGPDRARVLLARAGRDGAGAGRARAGERGAHEPAGQHGRGVEVAAGRRCRRRSWRSGCARTSEAAGRVWTTSQCQRRADDPASLVLT